MNHDVIMTAAWKAEHDWFHESNIQKEIKGYLKSRLGDPAKESDCRKKEKGPDLLYGVGAVLACPLQVEVKGYPSDKYTNGEKRGQKKRTPPNLQARHWFGEALLSLIMAKADNPDLQLAMGLPLMPIYEKLWKKATWATKALGIRCCWVSNDGAVTESNA